MHPTLCCTPGPRVQFVFFLFDFRWTWVPFTENPVSWVLITLAISLHFGSRDAWGQSLSSLGVLEFRVWSWRWELQEWRRGRLSSSGFNRLLGRSNSHEGLSWLSRDVKSGRPQARVAGSWGHLWQGRVIWMTHLGFLHILLVSGLLWSLPGRKASGFGSLLQGFLLTFLTQACISDSKYLLL